MFPTWSVIVKIVLIYPSFKLEKFKLSNCVEPELIDPEYFTISLEFDVEYVLILLKLSCVIPVFPEELEIS